MFIKSFSFLGPWNKFVPHGLKTKSDSVIMVRAKNIPIKLRAT